METKPKNTKTPTRVDTTLSQAILNLSLGIPALFALYLVGNGIQEDSKFKHDLEIENKKFKLESLKIVNHKYADSIIFNQKMINDSLSFKNKNNETDIKLLEIQNKIDNLKSESLRMQLSKYSK